MATIHPDRYAYVHISRIDTHTQTCLCTSEMNNDARARREELGFLWHYEAHPLPGK